MRRRHPPIPRLWLMTDERAGEALWTALAHLPRGSGVVFRHYATPHQERKKLFGKVGKMSKKYGHFLVVSRPERLGRGDGVHNPRRGRRRGTGHWLQTASAHSRREAVRAVRAGADAVFVSPVFATRSHPGARALGRVGLGLMIRGLKVPVIALGGMDARRARSLRALKIHGWAGIDAWSGTD